MSKNSWLAIPNGPVRTLDDENDDVLVGTLFCVHFEEAGGYVIDVILPYSKKRWFRAGSLGGRSKVASERRIFS
jgi:hypothetical protein